MDIPSLGDTLSLDDVDMLFQAFVGHREKHPEMDEGLSFYVALTKFGERFRPVQCIEQEWEGRIQDIPVREDGEVKCPNGHSLHKGQPGIGIGWIGIP
jgi:hypothetical protein